MGRKYFGTDGIRGLANAGAMTPEMAFRIGLAVTRLAREGASQGHAPRVVLGKDTRLSGYLFETALASGVCAMGGRVLLSGPLPTPAIAHLTTSMRADVGVVISASHNPYQDNGIKLFGPDGFKLPDEIEERIEALIDGSELDSDRPTGTQIGRAERLDDAPGRYVAFVKATFPKDRTLDRRRPGGGAAPRPAGTQIGRAERLDDAPGRYVAFVKATFPKDRTLDGVRVVVDAAHGAAYRTAPLVFSELGAEVHAIGIEPNGKNINDGFGALHPETCGRAVIEQQAALGIALDGDADRVIIIDEKGQVVDGDAVMAICATHMLKTGQLARNTLVATVMSNLGLERAVERAGGTLKRCAVGDRYVVEALREEGLSFGGEQSGHLIFLDHATTGDGLVAALQVLAVLLDEGKPLSELASKVMQRVPQVLLNERFTGRRPLDSMALTQRAIDGVRQRLGKDGRVLVRWSGTEPKLRVMVEGPNEQLIRTLAGEILDAARRDLR